MSVDTSLLFVRKDGVSRAEIEGLRDFEAGTVTWVGDRTFSVSTAVRFLEYEQSDRERRVRLVLTPMSLDLFERIEPFALAYPDLMELRSGNALQELLESGEAIRVEFDDFVPGDERLDEAAQEEARQTLRSVDAIVAFSRYLQRDPNFSQEFNELARAGRTDAMIERTRAVAELAPHVPALIESRHFESCVPSARSGRT